MARFHSNQLKNFGDWGADAKRGMQLLVRSIKQMFGRFGIAIYNLRGRYAQDGLLTAHSCSFREDRSFREAYARGVQASKGIDPGFEWRVHTALWAAQTSLRVDGDFVECGVNAGFISSAIMQGLAWNRVGRRFYLIDTFVGPVMEQYSALERTALEFFLGSATSRRYYPARRLRVCGPRLPTRGYRQSGASISHFRSVASNGTGDANSMNWAAGVGNSLLC